ncbi:MAG: MDR family NADPH-dependent oxidoreductase [Terrimicrobiaceae bacterium]
MPLAARLHQFGNPSDSISVTEAPQRPPAANEVVLEMLAAPINPADINVIEGKYGDLPPLPATIGNEGVGKIVRLGSDVTRMSVGQTVLPMAFGTWANEMTIPAASAVPLPNGIDIHQAAMLTVNPATAWRMLHDFADLAPGDWIVQNAANSGVGRSVIQLARALGLRTVNVVRRPELIEELLASGADHVVTEECDLRTEISSLCGGTRPKLGLNAVGGSSALNVANALARGGCVVTFGAMSKQALKIPNGLLIFSDIRFHGFWLKRWRENATRTDVQETYGTLARYQAKGVLNTPVDGVFPLTDLGNALTAAAKDKRAGKTLIDLTA